MTPNSKNQTEMGPIQHGLLLARDLRLIRPAAVRTSIVAFICAVAVVNGVSAQSSQYYVGLGNRVLHGASPGLPETGDCVVQALLLSASTAGQASVNDYASETQVGCHMAGTSMGVEWDPHDIQVNSGEHIITITQFWETGTVTQAAVYVTARGSTVDQLDLRAYCRMDAGGNRIFTKGLPPRQHWNYSGLEMAFASRLEHDSACYVQNGCQFPTITWTCPFNFVKSHPDVVATGSKKVVSSPAPAFSSIESVFHGLDSQDHSHGNDIRFKTVGHSYFYFSDSNPLEGCHQSNPCTGQGSDWWWTDNRNPWGHHDGIVESLNIPATHGGHNYELDIDVYDEDASQQFGAANDPPDAAEWDTCKGYVHDTPCRCIECLNPAYYPGDLYRPGRINVVNDVSLPLAVDRHTFPVDDALWASALDEAIDAWNDAFDDGDLFVLESCTSNPNCIEVIPFQIWGGNPDASMRTMLSFSVKTSQPCGNEVNSVNYPTEIEVRYNYPTDVAIPPNNSTYGKWHNGTSYKYLRPFGAGQEVLWPRPFTFAHELGHSVGLTHERRFSWGSVSRGNPDAVMDPIPRIPNTAGNREYTNPDASLLKAIECLLDKRPLQ